MFKWIKKKRLQSHLRAVALSIVRSSDMKRRYVVYPKEGYAVVINMVVGTVTESRTVEEYLDQFPRHCNMCSEKHFTYFQGTRAGYFCNVINADVSECAEKYRKHKDCPRRAQND
jgi:hypothetical protein